MATYEEIFDLRSNSGLRNKIAVAAVKKAQSLLDAATPTSAEVSWANAAITDPLGKANQLINYVLAANSGQLTGVILAASDSTIQTNVDAAVDALIAGGA